MKCIEDEIPFDLPDGWEWCNLGLLFSHNTGKALNSSNGSGTQLEYITTSNVYWDHFELEHLKTMPFTDDEIEKCTVQKGDLLVCEGGDIGRSAIWPFDEPIRIQNHLHRLRAYDKINTKFYYYILYLYKLNGKINGNGIGLQGLSSNALHAIIVPVPPVDEQMRIANQISKALEMVDNIDAQKDAISSCVSQAKSKILDLAIRGQLVPQDPSDEPASVLLDRIRAEKEALIKAGKIKRDKKESVIFKGEDNSYYVRTAENTESIEDWKIDAIPAGWEICCLGEVCDYGNCINVETDEIGELEWILDLEDIEKDTGRVIQKIRKKERDVNSTKHLFHEHQVLYSKLRPYLNKVVLSDDCGYCTSEILPLDFNEAILPEYARYYLMSPTFLAYADRCSYGVKMPRLGTPDGKKAVFLIPPYQEQKRIVEAIDGAFAQLDTLLSAIS